MVLQNFKKFAKIYTEKLKNMYRNIQLKFMFFVSRIRDSCGYFLDNVSDKNPFRKIHFLVVTIFSLSHDPQNM